MLRQILIVALVFVGLSRPVVHVLRQKAIEIPTAIDKTLEKSLLSPYPLVFDQDFYFLLPVITLNLKSGEVIALDGSDLSDLINGPWHWQTVPRHGLLSLLSEISKFSVGFWQYYFCEGRLLKSLQLKSTIEFAEIEYSLASSKSKKTKLRLQCEN